MSLEAMPVFTGILHSFEAHGLKAKLNVEPPVNEDIRSELFNSKGGLFIQARNIDGGTQFDVAPMLASPMRPAQLSMLMLSLHSAAAKVEDRRTKIANRKGI